MERKTGLRRLAALQSPESDDPRRGSRRWAGRAATAKEASPGSAKCLNGGRTGGCRKALFEGRLNHLATQLGFATGAFIDAIKNGT